MLDCCLSALQLHTAMFLLVLKKSGSAWCAVNKASYVNLEIILRFKNPVFWALCPKPTDGNDSINPFMYLYVTSILNKSRCLHVKQRYSK